MKSHQLRPFLTALLGASLTGLLPAQQATPAPVAPIEESPATAAGETIKLEVFEVNDTPINQVVLPQSRPFNSVFGVDRSILETPRNVTIFSREQLSAINIQDVRDFSKLTASSYTRTNFGAPTTPDIRSQIADTFLNGARVGLSSNGNGLPINFNSVESVNIVKGPATVIYGASQYVGGYADMISKRPTFGKAEAASPSPPVPTTPTAGRLTTAPRSPTRPPTASPTPGKTPRATSTTPRRTPRPSTSPSRTGPTPRPSGSSTTSSSSPTTPRTSASTASPRN